MTTCQMAGDHCRNHATTVVRIAGVGDRPLCTDCIAILERLGTPFRRLDEKTPIPDWRRRSLARDLTGGLL